MEVTVGDLQRVAAAAARACPPISDAPAETKMWGCVSGSGRRADSQFVAIQPSERAYTPGESSVGIVERLESHDGVLLVQSLPETIHGSRHCWSCGRGTRARVSAPAAVAR